MAITILNTASLNGINGNLVSVEVNICEGMPNFNIVGLADISVKESKERVRAAILNCKYEFPMGRITINLAPADLKKEGSLLDLPIALGILLATKQIICDDIENYIIIGELSLNGEIKMVKGALPIVSEATNNNIKNFIVPYDNAEECSLIKEAKIYPFQNLKQVIDFLKYKDLLPYEHDFKKTIKNKFSIDFSDVKGQEASKRAIEVACAGGHNICLFGPPGSGKTMLAKRIPTILPKMTYDECLEVTKIYSVCGKLNKNNKLIESRPFRNPNNTSSKIALVGGGNKLMPGEISLAHNGILFLDEMLEFNKSVLNVLREPLEDKEITISRCNGSVKYPANFMLVAAMNPCPCGFYGSNVRQCICSEYERKRYLNRFSGPLVDRIDIFSSVNALSYNDLNSTIKSENSLTIRNRILNARRIQNKRFKDLKIKTNSQMGSIELNKFCKINAEASKIVEKIYSKYSLSVRAYSRILKVARTIADLNNLKQIDKLSLIEAIQYRKFINNNII